MRKLFLVVISFSVMTSFQARATDWPDPSTATPPTQAEANNFGKPPPEFDGPFQGLQDAEEQIKKKAKSARDETPKTPGAGEKLKKAAEDCADGVKGAKDDCTQSGSPDLSGIMDALKGAMAAQQGAQSNCSNAAQQQQQNQQPQAPAQKAKNKCQKKQSDCKKKCDQAKQDSEQVKNDKCKTEAKKLPEDEREDAEKACVKSADKAKSAADDGNKACGAPVDSQLAGMAAALAGFAMGQQKAEANQAQMCCQDPSFAAANATQCKQVVNCNDITQAQSNPQCICDISARSCKPVTDNGTPPTQETPASTAGGGGGGSGLGSSATNPFANDTTASTGGSGLPGGGSSGSGGGIKGAGIDASKSAGAKINTNVLGGDYGGSAGRGASSNDEPAEKYRKMLKDQMAARALASEKVQVSGSFGPDNWQKVQQRYVDFQKNILGR